MLNSFGVALGNYRRSVIVKNSGTFGCRLFVLREIPEDEWLHFFGGGCLRYDVLMFAANHKEELAAYDPYLAVKVPRVGLLILETDGDISRTDLPAFKFSGPDFFEHVMQVLARPEGSLSLPVLEHLRRKEAESSGLRTLLFVGLPLLFSALFLARRLFK